MEGHKDARASVGLDAQCDLTALQLASLYEAPVVETLLAAGAPCDLHSACATGRIAEIRRLAAPNACAALAEHLTPMGFAINRGQLASVRALLESGDDPCRPLPRIGFFVWELAALARGHGGWAPLHAACAHGYAPDAAAIVSALIDAGGDLEAPCALGDRPIHLAATYGWLPVLNALLAAGAAVDSRTQSAPRALWRLASPESAEPAWGQTALMVAAREGALDAAKCLLGHGASLTARDNGGRTPLHVAACAWWKENAELAALLVEAGADGSALDGHGRKPWELAEQAGYKATAAVLERRAG